MLIVGLAPAAHGGNRTGRIFTGDRSGDWLFAALHRAGLANQPTSAHAGDGQRLSARGCVAAVRCAPPDNKPTPAERDTCAPWLDRELALLLPAACGWSSRSAAFAWAALLAALPAGRARRCRGRGPRSGTAPEVELGRAASLLGSLPPQPAEHLHRPADRADAGRRALLAARLRRTCAEVSSGGTQLYAA